MEKYGYKYIHQLPSVIITLNSRRDSSIDMRPNTAKKCYFLSFLYSKPLREYKKPTFKNGDRVRISNYDSLFRSGYKSQYTREFFELVPFVTRKPPTYTNRDEQDEIIQGKFYQKELMEFI